MSVDLTTRYLGLSLRNPIVASACPLTGSLESLKRLEDSGISAAVLPSLFEEQIVHEENAINDLHEFQTDSFAESLDYFPEMNTYNTGPDSYLDLVRSAKEALDIPIIASLNGVSSGGWTRYAAMIEQAGADALELNIYVIPTDSTVSGQAIDQQYVDLVASVRKTVSIPLAVKVGPFFSSIPNVAERFHQVGANGLVLFNRYLAPDIDLESLEVVPHLALSSREELHLTLRWIAILYGEVDVSLAATSGIHGRDDALKALLAGADVTMMASALLRKGPSHVATVLRGLDEWLNENEYESVEQLKGSVSRKNCSDPSAWLRANYMRALISYSGEFI